MINVTLPRCLPPCLCACVEVDDSGNTVHERELDHHQNGATMPFQDGEAFNLAFRSRKQLRTGDSTRPAYEMLFEWPPGEERRLFSPGEVIGIICPNDRDEVEKMLRLLALTGSERVQVSPSGDDAARKRFERQFQYIPEQCSVRHLFTWVVDLRTVLKKVFLRILGDCCPEDSEDRKKLHEMSSIAEVYKENVLDDRTMILDILETYPLCSPNLSVLIENLSRLGPRFYSVANYDSDRVKIIYRPMTFRSRGRTLMGECSTYFEEIDKLDFALEGLSIGDIDHVSMKPTSTSTLRCYKRKNVRNFTFPCDNCTSFMFVCHGTGVAPLEAYLDWMEKSDPLSSECERWIFYGCRDIDNDDLFSVEKARKLGFKLVFRQSRKEPRQGYIQSAISDCSDDFVRVVKNLGGTVLICGDYNTMAVESLEALKTILNDREDPDVVAKLLKQNRIKLDVWT